MYTGAILEPISVTIAGEPLDLSGPIAPDLVGMAAQGDPSILAALAPYNAMLTTSACLDPVRERARELLAGGWRPPAPDGPTRTSCSPPSRASRR
jgi:hypothetical protein